MSDQSFNADSTIIEGPATHPSDSSIGSCRIIGAREKQEDRFYTSSFVSVTEDQAATLLENTVAAINQDTKTHTSGSTFTGAIVTDKGNVVTAHLGDSPAAIFIYDPKKKTVEVKALTVPHKGRLFDNDGIRLAVTHALGDVNFAVSHIPSIGIHDLSTYHKQGKRVLLFVGSDGALNKDVGVTLENHAKLLETELRENPGISLEELSQKIADSSDGTKDNITVTLAEVNPKKPVVLGVFDGHGGDRTSEATKQEFERIITNVKERGLEHAFTHRTQPLGEVTRTNRTSHKEPSIYDLDEETRKFVLGHARIVTPVIELTVEQGAQLAENIMDALQQHGIYTVLDRDGKTLVSETGPHVTEVLIQEIQEARAKQGGTPPASKPAGYLAGLIDNGKRDPLESTPGEWRIT